MSCVRYIALAMDEHVRACMKSLTSAKRSSCNSTCGKCGISNAGDRSENNPMGGNPERCKNCDYGSDMDQFKDIDKVD